MEELILFDLKVLEGNQYLFRYNKEKDVLEQFGLHSVSETFGEINVDENTGKLYFENLEWTKID